MGKLQLETMVLGMVGTNCYLAMNRETKEMIIIDPADAPDRIRNKVTSMGGRPTAVLLTHGHFDHIGAAEAIGEAYDIPVCILEQEKALAGDPRLNASVSMIRRSVQVIPDRTLHDGEELDLAGFRVRVLHTPGHTRGGACYYIEEENVLFSGDTLFCGSVGRTDLPTGSMAQLHDSVHNRLFVLPEDTLVYPGHGEMTDIAYEKRYNPY